jgi:hypothetical protein
MAKKGGTDKVGDGGHYAAYEQHANTLRTWLVAYGIGAPVLFANTSTIWSKLQDTGQLRFVVILFLSGVAIQVVLTSINKAAMWLCYLGEGDTDFAKSRYYLWASTISRQFFIDILCDVASIACFGFATYRALIALVSLA